MSPKKLSTKEQHKVFASLSQKQKTKTRSGSSASLMKQFDDHPFYKNVVKYAIIPAWEENRKAKKENREISNRSEELKYHIRVFARGRMEEKLGLSDYSAVFLIRITYRTAVQ